MAYEFQKSFSGGEISPLMHLRNDEDIFSESVALLKNMIPTPQGPARSRRGFEFIIELVGENGARLFDLDISFGESYVIAVTDNFIYIIDRNGFIQGANIVLNPSFVGGADWESDNVTFIAGTAQLDPTPGANARISQELTTPDPLIEHTIDVHGVGVDGNSPFFANIGTTEEGSEIESFQGVGANFSDTFIPGVSPFWITIDVPAGRAIKVLDHVDVYPSVDAGDTVTFPSPYSVQDIIELQIDKEPGNKTMFFFTRNVPPQELTFAGTNIWDFGPVEFDFGLDDQLNPNPSVWGEDQNPGCITFYAGRMAVGGTFEEPIGIWLSKPREYRNFDQGDPDSQVPDDSLFLPLDKHGELVWLKGNKQLFAGLDSGEHVIFGEEGIISSGNASTEQHSTYGSARIQPQVVNEQVAYVDTRGRKVRLMDYQSNTRNMKSFDISYIAEHITIGTILEMKHGSSPLSVLYFTTRQGRLISCHIEKDRGIYGWNQDDSRGFIQSVTVIREFGIDVPWISVLRNGRLFLERIDTTQAVFTDSHLTIEEIVPTTQFFGFDHLISANVQVVADGVVHPDVTVAGDGSITLQFEANIVSAGLQYIPEIETLPQMNDTEEGNTKTHIKRFSKVSVAILNSPRPIINGQDTYRRDPATPMGEREPDKTEIVEITNSGWDNDAIINIQQPLPLKMIITGIGGKLKSSKL